MHHSILENKQVTIMLFFFNKKILGALKNLCLPQNEKQGFIFFAHLKKKQNKQLHNVVKN